MQPVQWDTHQPKPNVSPRLRNDRSTEEAALIILKLDSCIFLTQLMSPGLSQAMRGAGRPKIVHKCADNINIWISRVSRIISTSGSHMFVNPDTTTKYTMYVRTRRYMINHTFLALLSIDMAKPSGKNLTQSIFKSSIYSSLPACVSHHLMQEESVKACWRWAASL